MANTFIDYNGNGSQTTFNYSFPILNESHVVVKIDKVKQTFNTDYTVAYNPTTQSGTVTITGGAPSNNSKIRIQRVSAPSQNLVDFVNGARLTESSLDTAYLHTRYLAEESTELSDSALTTISSGGQTFLDAANLEIRDIAAPTLPSSAATKNYVDSQDALKVSKNSPEVTNILDMNNNRIHSLGQPASGNDATTKTYVDGEINTLDNAKLPKSNPVISTNLDANSKKVINLANPTNTNDAANKFYVDDKLQLKVSKSGDSMSGALSMGNNNVRNVANPASSGDAAPKSWIEGQDQLRVLKSGDTMTGNLILYADPTAMKGAATKQYVDERVAINSTNLTTFEHQSFTGDGTTTAFAWTNSYQPETTNSKAYIVSIDGVLQPPTAYTIAESNITFTAAPPNSSAVHVVTAAGAATINLPVSVEENPDRVVFPLDVNVSGQVLCVTFRSTTNASVGGNLQVDGNCDLRGDVDVDDNLDVGGTSHFAGQINASRAHFDDHLTSSSNIYASSGFVNTDQLRTNNIYGKTGGGGTPAGDVTVHTNLNCTGNIDADQLRSNHIYGENASGDVTVNTNLKTTGDIILGNASSTSSGTYKDSIRTTTDKLKGSSDATLKVPNGIFVDHNTGTYKNGIYYGGLNISDYRRREFTYTGTGGNITPDSNFGASGVPSNFSNVFDSNGYFEMFTTAYGLNPILPANKSKFRFEIFLNMLMEKEGFMDAQSMATLSWEICRQSTSGGSITVMQAGFLSMPNSVYSSWDDDFIVNPRFTAEITPPVLSAGARYFFRLRRTGSGFPTLSGTQTYWLNWEKYWGGGILANTYRPCTMIFTEVPMAQ